MDKKGQETSTPFTLGTSMISNIYTYMNYYSVAFSIVYAVVASLLQDIYYFIGCLVAILVIWMATSFYNQQPFANGPVDTDQRVSDNSYTKINSSLKKYSSPQVDDTQVNDAQVNDAHIPVNDAQVDDAQVDDAQVDDAQVNDEQVNDAQNKINKINKVDGDTGNAYSMVPDVKNYSATEKDVVKQTNPQATSGGATKHRKSQNKSKRMHK